MKKPFYTLDAAGDPVPCDDALVWATWFATNDASRVVARTQISAEVHVSTVFLGIDHGFREGAPVLWETMIFGGDYDLACDRYRSKKEAIVGHEKWVLVAKGEMTPIDARSLKEGFPVVPVAGSSYQKKPQKKEA